MRKLLVLAALVPSLALAQGVARPRAPREAILFTAQVNTAASAINYFAVVNPAPVTVRSVSIYQSSAGGGGAGSTVVRITDGTNNCDATFACSTTTGTNAALTASTTGACTFTRGAAILVGFSASSCTTSQPGIRSIVATGSVYP